MLIKACLLDLEINLKIWPFKNFELLGCKVKLKQNAVYIKNNLSISLLGMLQITNDQKLIPKSMRNVIITGFG